MVSDLKIDLNENGNLVRVNFEVCKSIFDMNDVERSELFHDLLHIQYHISNDLVDIAFR